MRKLLATIPIVLFSLLASGQALATNATNQNQCARPAPYTGGAAISQVFYPSDGSTITVTKTGAVIKQSPCHTAYREDWVSTCNLGNMSYGQVVSQLRPGSSNPYSANCNSSTSTTSSSSASNASASTNSNYNYNYNYNMNTPAPIVQASDQTAAAASQNPASTPSTSSGKGSPLPNTGPADVLAVGGIATVIGTVGHLALQVIRRR